MDLKEIGINAGKLADSAQDRDYFENPCKCGIEPPDSINHGVSQLVIGLVGLGDLDVTCSLRDPRFAGSNPAEVDGFFSGHKNPELKSSGTDFKLGVPSLKFQAR